MSLPLISSIYKRGPDHTLNQSIDQMPGQLAKRPCSMSTTPRTTKQATPFKFAPVTQSAPKQFRFGAGRSATQTDDTARPIEVSTARSSKSARSITKVQKSSSTAGLIAPLHPPGERQSTSLTAPQPSPVGPITPPPPPPSPVHTKLAAPPSPITKSPLAPPPASRPNATLSAPRSVPPYSPLAPPPPPMPAPRPRRPTKAQRMNNAKAAKAASDAMHQSARDGLTDPIRRPSGPLPCKADIKLYEFVLDELIDEALARDRRRKPKSPTRRQPTRKCKPVVLPPNATLQQIALSGMRRRRKERLAKLSHIERRRLKRDLQYAMWGSRTATSTGDDGIRSIDGWTFSNERTSPSPTLDSEP